ncbi:MAG: hypothetical protein PHF35_00675 [Candidatus Moranbacteria bacterium]|nr:hypothetical protein [Candidatus Moranbacteria bacterium]
MLQKYYNLQFMQLKLYIEENNFIKLALFEGKKVLDSLEWQDENDLSHKLLANLDKILRKNKLGLDPAPILREINLSSKDAKNKKRIQLDAGQKGRAIRPTRRAGFQGQNWSGVDKLDKYNIISQVPRKWTTYRIAEIAFETLKIGENSSPIAKNKQAC